MSYTTKLNLFKHNEPLDENENPFDIKTALNDNWDIIDDYADETDTKIEEKETEIQNLENILPKSTATGEEIYIQNSANYKFNYFNNGGNTHQDSYEGRNLFNNNATPNTSPALATKIDTGIRMTMGTTSSSSYFSVWVLKDLTNYVGKTVRAKSKFSINGNNNAKYYIGLANSTGSSRTNMAETNITNTEISFVVPELSDKPYLILALYANISGNAQAGDYVDYTETIVTIDNENLEYEPYVGGTNRPNPSYPQDIVNVGSNVNLFDKDNMLVGKALVVSSGAEYGTSGWNSTNYIPVEKGKDFCINSAEIGNSNNYGICYYDGNKSFISGQSWNSLGYNSTVVRDNIIFNVDNDNIKYVRISIRTANTDFNKLKIEKGSTSTGYTPYNRGGIDVLVQNKNIFNDTFEVGSIDSSGNNSSSSVNIRNVNYVRVQPNTNYVISINGYTNNIGLRYYDKNKTFISSQSSSASPRNFTTPENCYYMRFVVVSTTDTTIQVQIEKGTTKTDFIAHAEQKVTIPLPEGMELCKIGDYSDKIFHNIPTNSMYNASLTEGGWYKYKIINKKIFNGTENLEYNTVYTDTVLFALLDSSCYLVTDFTITYAIANYLKGTDRESIVANNPNTIALGNNNNRFFLNITREIVGEGNTGSILVANAKTWLTQLYNNETPLEVYYVTATPTYTQITDTDSITALNTLENTKTYQGITNITSDNYPSPVFDVQYFLDLQSLFN